MQSPLQITFRHMDPSAALEARIRQRAGELDAVCDRIISAHVTVECPHPRRHYHGKVFEVRVDLALPGKDIVVAREPPTKHAHEDPYVAVRDAFDAVRRRLEDYVRERRGDVKRHSLATPPVSAAEADEEV
jgi:ribosome-associated translation inhibitor RaiA